LVLFIIAWGESFVLRESLASLLKDLFTDDGRDGNRNPLFWRAGSHALMYLLRIKVAIISLFGRAYSINGFSLAISRVPRVGRVAQHGPDDRAFPSSNIAACGDSVLSEFACDGPDAQMLIN